MRSDMERAAWGRQQRP